MTLQGSHTTADDFRQPYTHAIVALIVCHESPSLSVGSAVCLLRKTVSVAPEDGARELVQTREYARGRCAELVGINCSFMGACLLWVVDEER